MTFGQPRIGNGVFASLYSKLVPNTIRVTNDHDIVPHLPPYYYHLPQKTYQHFPREVRHCIMKWWNVYYLDRWLLVYFSRILHTCRTCFQFVLKFSNNLRCCGLQVWLYNIGLGSLVYRVEKICDGSGEDPSCSRLVNLLSKCNLKSRLIENFATAVDSAKWVSSKMLLKSELLSFIGQWVGIASRTT
jgi:hypothetical protein